MAQRASLRDQTPLSVEKRRSNRTVYVLRSCSRAAWTVNSDPRVGLRARWCGTTGRLRSDDGGRTGSS